ncbi:hypothetical protein H2201_000397 [Coniosporium apollinis]|uniref:Uncharacterized protein n=1 Tax=Coniosporium apollinis TaxID=61459 RepID=A0ABQ9P4R6_9PEZI|nr:hypothetical protein H2201_000397 [Coniosporium apollinis]
MVARGRDPAAVKIGSTPNAAAIAPLTPPRKSFPPAQPPYREDPSSNMPPHLHPRSRLTTSLFTTALFASFLVVGLPHLLPCPANPREYADGDMPELDPSGRRRRRRRKVVEGDTAMAGAHPLASEAPVVEEPKAADSALDEEGWERRRARECPVPKPGGLIGQVFGFQQDERQRPVVRIESVRRRGTESRE